MDQGSKHPNLISAFVDPLQVVVLFIDNTSGIALHSLCRDGITREHRILAGFV